LFYLFFLAKKLLTHNAWSTEFFMELPTMKRLYKNRLDAARVLARSLTQYAGRSDVLVLGLPRGGVPIACIVASALNASVDLMLVRKLGVPGHEELAMGAIATGGVRVLNMDVVTELDIPAEIIERVAETELLELQRRERVYRGERAVPELGDRCVILVDDGLATGATMRAAIAAARQQGPARLVVAVPVAPPSTIASLSEEVDEVVCPATPEPFFGIGLWYDVFEQMSDEEVRSLLSHAWQNHPTRTDQSSNMATL
jgi:putative phosphoribosyl transferase